LSWTECIDPFNVKELKPHIFFRHTPKSKYFTLGDTAKLCPICWEQAHKRNTPYVSTPGIPLNHRPDSKPEKDSL